MRDGSVKYYGGEAREWWKRLSDYTVKKCYGKGRVYQCITKLMCCVYDHAFVNTEPVIR